MRIPAGLLAISLSIAMTAPIAFAADDATTALHKSVTFYASFDEMVRGDFGGGVLELSTRFEDPLEKGKFTFEPGFNAQVFKIAPGKGISGGALEPVDVLPRNGRVFFPMRGNLAFRKGGWSGALSLWCNGNPNQLLKTTFCDPVQITHKGANNGGLWFDFNNAMPRDMRHGAFPAVPAGQKPIAEEDPNAPMVRVPKIDWQTGDWHHVVLSWRNFDTGKSDAVSALYIDGKLIGQIKDRPLAMDWDVDKGGIYVAVNYLGLLDELALFNRDLTVDEVRLLHARPGLLSPLKGRGVSPKQSLIPAPKFPFDAQTATRYQQEVVKQLRLPVTLTDRLGMVFALVPPGSFVMGSPADEPGHGSGGYDETPHEVTLTESFYLAKHEVTVRQFRMFVEATQYVTDGEKNGGGNAHDELAVWKHRAGVSWRKPGYAEPFELRDEHPVVHVSHADATAFCRWLNDLSREPGEPAGRYCLPTEAQWEWACRAGSADRYWWGAAEDTTGQVANVGDTSLKRVHPDWPRTVMPMDDRHPFAAPVGSYRANAFGLHDMLGNVWEFCSTRYGAYPAGRVTDPADFDSPRGLAVRGGGWTNIATDARCASRNADPPHFCHSNLGFRVAFIPTALPNHR